MRYRRFGAAALGLACFLAACGGGSNNGQQVSVEATPAAIRKAATDTAAEGTSKVDMTMAIEINGQTATMTGTGVVEEANRRGDLTFDMKDFIRAAASGQSVSSEQAALF